MTPLVGAAVAGVEPAGTTPRTGWPVYAAVRFLAALVLFGAGAVLYRSARSASAPPVPSVPAVACWTTGVAVVLWVLRGPLDRLANVLRFGRGATGYEAVRALLQRMSTSLPIDEVVPQLAESVGRSTRSTRTDVRINLDGGQQSSQVWPPTATGGGRPLTAQIRHLGDDVGSLEIDTAEPDAGMRRRLLAEVSGPAGVAMSAVRLTWSLRRRVAELTEVNQQIRESQRRLVTARLDAQVDMQRQIQQRVLVHLQGAEDALTRAGSDLSESAINSAADGLRAALDSLRSIARGVYPPRLEEAGLVASLTSWGEGLHIPVSVSAGSAAEPLHRQPDIQACLYFVLVDAGAWAVRNGCTSIAIEIVGGDGQVRFDQTVAGVSSWPDDEQLVVADRLAAFGGTFEICGAGDGSGLRLTGRLPLSGTGSPARSTDLGSAVLTLDHR